MPADRRACAFDRVVAVLLVRVPMSKVCCAVHKLTAGWQEPESHEAEHIVKSQQLEVLTCIASSSDSDVQLHSVEQSLLYVLCGKR